MRYNESASAPEYLCTTIIIVMPAGARARQTALRAEGFPQTCTCTHTTGTLATPTPQPSEDGSVGCCNSSNQSLGKHDGDD